MPTFRRSLRRGLVAALALACWRAGSPRRRRAGAGRGPRLRARGRLRAGPLGRRRRLLPGRRRRRPTASRVETLGESTQGRPFLAAVISARGDDRRPRPLQGPPAPARRPRPPTAAADEEAASLVAESKTTVLITCSIHSSETASTLMACALLHELATGRRPGDPGDPRPDDPAAGALGQPRRRRHRPRLVRAVARGRPWEGSGMPRLYHPYAGHDTNRDWFMLNLDETRLLTRLPLRGVVPDDHLGRPPDGLRPAPGCSSRRSTTRSTRTSTRGSARGSS